MPLKRRGSGDLDPSHCKKLGRYGTVTKSHSVRLEKLETLGLFVASVLDTVVCVANHLVALVLHVVILKVPPSIVDCKENQC